MKATEVSTDINSTAFHVPSRFTVKISRFSAYFALRNLPRMVDVVPSGIAIRERLFSHVRKIDTSFLSAKGNSEDITTDV